MHAESSIVAPAQAGLELLIGSIPHRVALAGGWIDQPFVSSRNPSPPGSMVVVGLEPDRWFMERAGMASGTRRVALQLWSGVLPNRPREELVRELYRAENDGKAEPSGSQDMIGLIYPGVSRLDYDAAFEGGLFPAHIESNCDPAIARWLERVLQFVPVNQRPEGYNPLGCEEPGSGVDPPPWPDRQGLLRRHPPPRCRRPRGFHELLHGVLGGYPPAHRLPLTIHIDLKALLANFQARYPGAMYSGCGGGYLMMIAEDDVPGALRVRIRTESRRNSGHAQNRHP